MEVWWLALSLLLTVLVTLVFAVVFVRHYEDPRERTCLTTTVSAVAIASTMFCVFLIPVDIYTVSSSLNSDGSQTDASLVSHTGEAVKWFYYVLYIVLLALAFFILPFTYFYYEEGVGAEGGDGGRDSLLTAGKDAKSGGATARKSVNAPRDAMARRWSAFKYMLGFAVVFAVLLTLGLVLRTTHGSNDSGDWKSKLSNSFSAGDAIMTFCVATLACLGVFSWIIYGGYGLAAVPIRMMQKAHNDRTLLAEQRAASSVLPTSNKTASGAEDIEMSLASVQEQIKFLSSKYDLTSNEWSIKDKNEYRKLKQKETELLARQRRREASLKAGGDGDGLSVTERCDRCWNALAPLRIVVGVILLGIALLIFISLLLSVIDKLAHSPCGTGCGYTMDKPQIVNPLDVTLVAMGKVFPIDYLAFAGIVIFMFLCAVMGMVALGIRLIGFKLWNVRPGHTMPNALLMGCWILMFVALALNMEILTFAPQYATFGAQFYMRVDINNSTGTVELVRSDCTIDMSDTAPLSDPNGSQCVMSQVARFIQLINVELPFFGVILFFANLIWLAMYAVVGVYVVACKRKVDHQALKEEAIDDLFYSED